MATIEEVVALANALPPAERLRVIECLLESTAPESWPAANDADVAAAKRRLIDSDAHWRDPVPWPIVQRLLADSIRRSRPKVYSAPRRFDLTTIFIVTVAYSLLLGAMSLLRFPAGLSLAVAGFITIIGTSQALLFGGKKPRLASTTVGAAIYSLCMMAMWIADGRRMYSTQMFLFTGPAVVLSGALTGYVAGACVGAVFMLAEFLRRAVRLAAGEGNSPSRQIE